MTHDFDRAAMIWRAIQLAEELGWSVVPKYHTSGATCVPWGPYQHERPTSDTLSGWFDVFRKTNQYAVITGVISGLVCVDADDADAVEYVHERCPDTPLKQRSSRGLHAIYRHPGHFVKTVAKLGRPNDPAVLKVDIRGDGGLFVGPLSLHRLGAVYTEIQKWTPELLASAPVYSPYWLFPDEEDAEAMSTPARVVTPAELPAVDVATADGRVRQAARWLAAVPGTTVGGGADSKCFWVAVQLVQGFALDPADALPLMCGWGVRDDQVGEAGRWHPWTEKELTHKLTDAAGRPDRSGRPRGWKLRADLGDEIGRLTRRLEESRRGVDAPLRRELYGF